MQPRLLVAVLAALVMGISPAFAKQKFKTVYSFGENPPFSSSTPWSGLIADKLGNVYGTTFAGGEFGGGTVFVFSHAGVETDIYPFASGAGEGTNPKAGIAFDKNGNIFGTTSGGGDTGNGAVYELIPTNGSYTGKALYSFCSLANCADGSSTPAAVTVGTNGALYGTTPFGGLGAAGQNNGVIFRLSPPRGKPGAWTETVLHAFCSQPSCADGTNPSGAPLLTKDGFLYGTASFGGQGGGVLYRVKPDGTNFEMVHTFLDDGEDGFISTTSLTADKSGIIYGTTGDGGIAGAGTVFSLDPNTSSYSKIYDFHGGDDSNPHSGLTIVETKKTKIFYGQLSGSGPQLGAVYSLSPPAKQGDPWTDQVLHAFCAKKNCADGAYISEDSKLANVRGAIYGTTTGGGLYDGGVIFRINKN